MQSIQDRETSKRIEENPDFLRAPYLLVLDASYSPGWNEAAFLLMWRTLLVPEPTRIRSDVYWMYAVSHDNLVETCSSFTIWERVKCRGIIDLRSKPIRFSVVGRKFLPYLTEWDVLMRTID